MRKLKNVEEKVTWMVTCTLPLHFDSGSDWRPRIGKSCMLLSDWLFCLVRRILCVCCSYMSSVFSCPVKYLVQTKWSDEVVRKQVIWKDHGLIPFYFLTTKAWQVLGLKYWKCGCSFMFIWDLWVLHPCWFISFLASERVANGKLIWSDWRISMIRLPVVCVVLVQETVGRLEPAIAYVMW